MRLLLIDNYDSFTWNLFQLLKKAGVERIEVVKNDHFIQEQLDEADTLVFSPGPGLPSQAGLMNKIIALYAGSKRMLGVCLGHQAIGEVFGAQMVHSGSVFHGTSTPLQIIGHDRIFNNIPQNTLVGRYHSWIVSREKFPEPLLVTAIDAQGNIMAMRHKEFDITGVQFHPESFMTPLGLEMIRNWIGG